MKSHFKKNGFKYAIIGGLTAIIGSAIHCAHLENTSDEQVNEKNAYQQVIKNLDSQYGENSRLSSVIREISTTAKRCLDMIENNKELRNHRKYCETARTKYLQPIANGDIKISLSTELPAFSVVQVFKDAIILHENLPASTQQLALSKTFDYMAEQKADGLAYGDGETFTIAEGEVSYYKGSRRAPYILIPSN